MNQKLLPGDRVFWYRVSKGSVLAKKVAAEVYYKPSPERVAIRFTDMTGERVIRFVAPENLEKIDGEDCSSVG